MKILFAGIFVFLSVTSFAQQPQASKIRNIAEQLRCPTCEAQSVADSQAPIAKEIRSMIEQRLAQNKTDQVIMAELTDKYGDHISLSPPLAPSTYLLWFLPLLGLALVLVFWRVRAHKY